MVSRFCFVQDHRNAFGVKRLCQVLGLSRSGFYGWRAGEAARAQRAASDAELTARITAVHEADPANGSPRITAELREQGHRVNHKRVERLMRAAGLQGIHLRRKVRTTVPEPSDQPVPDLLGRDFTATGPNTRYVGDITYLPMEGGRFCYLASVIDLYSRRVVGWSIAEHMRTSLVVDALAAARRERGSLAGAVFHSDHGAQYTSKEFAAACEEAGVARSMGAVGSSADNAAAEAFNATLKRETLQGPGLKRWESTRAARLAVFSWIARYNTKRRHSANGQLSPLVYEQQAASLELAA
ncbi:Transposase [Nocardiopsis rhodophaea]